MKFPVHEIPLVEIKVKENITLFIKREDLVHRAISGNKYWKLFYNINNYLAKQPEKPQLITFGGAYSNHIAATAALGKDLGIATLGIIRGGELANSWQQNPTLLQAAENGMKFRFITRQQYRNKSVCSTMLEAQFPGALLIPEGGSNATAVQGVQHMLNKQTESFDYLCTAVGTGGTAAGLASFCADHQQVLGFAVVNDSSLPETINSLKTKGTIHLHEAHDGGYGKITEENVRFINNFHRQYGIPLDPVYTGKMMRKLILMINDNYFPPGSRILAFHTGGLQGIQGANEKLRRAGQPEINFTHSL